MAERAKLFAPILVYDVLIIWYWLGNWPLLLLSLLSALRSVCVRWALLGRWFVLRGPCPLAITRDVLVGRVGITTS